METDRLVERIKSTDNELTDVFVIESGSDKEKLSKNCTWWVNDSQTMKEGLRLSKGFNFGFCELLKENKYQNYDYFLLLFNDIEIDDGHFLDPLIKIMKKHPRLGILSPCSHEWGEKFLFKNKETKYVWVASQCAWLIRRDFIEDVRTRNSPSVMNFLYDGNNFRSYQSDLELIMKGYLNDWTTAITTEVWATENKSHLLQKSDLIKTEPYQESLQLCLAQGREWLHQKYGYKSRWQMPMQCKLLYDQFFQHYPEYVSYRI